MSIEVLGLEPCPFCGHSGVHMRKKTQMRVSVTGLTYIETHDAVSQEGFPVFGAYQNERPCYDYRFGVRFYCGKCRIETPYVWGEWHLPTADEAEEFDALPHACERFDAEQESDIIGRAAEIWNTRAEPTHRERFNCGARVVKE